MHKSRKCLKRQRSQTLVESENAMTYEEILPLVRREKFTPLRVILNDGRSYEMRAFGQFMLAPAWLSIRLPYELTHATNSVESVRLQYSEIKQVVELSEGDARASKGASNASA